MKTAICLYGQPRFYEKTFRHFFYYLKESLDADLYFHTWWSEKMVGTLYPCAPHAKASLNDEDLLVTRDLPDQLIELYQPVDYLFDDYDILKSEFNKSNYYQYYTQWQVGQLIRTRYDLIIRSRFDLMCTQDIELVQDDSVWVPSCCPYTDGRVNDMFSISNHDNFLRLSETFLNLKEFEDQGKGEMEWALASQIQKEKLTVRTFKADYSTFDILRSDTAKKYS
jgi:hypothetical protein